MSNNATESQRKSDSVDVLIVEIKKLFAVKKYGNSDDIVSFVPFRKMTFAGDNTPVIGDEFVFKYPTARNRSGAVTGQVAAEVIRIVENEGDYTEICVGIFEHSGNVSRLPTSGVSLFDENDLISAYSECGWDMHPQEITDEERARTIATIEEQWNIEFSDMLD